MFSWGNREVPSADRKFPATGKFSAHREQGGRLDLRRKDYNFRKLTLMWDIQRVSLRFRREILDREKNAEVVSTWMVICDFESVPDSRHPRAEP